MNLSVLKQQIQSNTPDDFYIFTGAEWEIQRIYIRQIAKVRKLQIVYADNFASVYSKAKNSGFLGGKSLYVLLNDKSIQTLENVQIRANSGILNGNVLICIYTDIDKRTKFYNSNKDRIVEFEQLSDTMLKKYILKEMPDFSDRNCQKLIDVCEHNYGRILLEIDKIKRYKLVGELMVTDDYQVLEDDCFQMLLKDGTIYQPPKDAIFDLVDAILDRKGELVFDLLQQSVAVGEATMVILSVLYKNAKAVLQVQSCKNTNITQTTGLSAWEVQCAKKHVGKYRIGELVQMLKLLQEVESKIKKGVIPEDIAVEYVLVEVL